MEQFLDKLDNFLFDIIGLVFPGFVFLTILSFPVYFIDLQNQVDNNLVNLILRLKSKGAQLLELDQGYIFIIMISYILGHFVKVFSTFFYEFMRILFDDGIFKIIQWLANQGQKLDEFLFKNCEVPKEFAKFFNKIYRFVVKYLRKIFSFKSSPYFPANENIKDMCLKKLKENGDFPNEWHSIYKYSVILNQQNKVRSLTENFLSKYNLYRSLSLIFVISFFYFILLCKIFDNLDDMIILKDYIFYVSITNVLFWYVFHVKFKRYWQLCGNEALMSLYFYFTHESKPTSDD